MGNLGIVENRRLRKLFSHHIENKIHQRGHQPKNHQEKPLGHTMYSGQKRKKWIAEL